MDKKEIEVTKFALTNNVNNEKTLELSLKINTTAYDWLKDIAKIKPQFVPKTVEPSEWFDKAQKKQIEAMNDTVRNSMQCCTPIRSICDTCRKVFVCPMQHIEHREKCGLYEPLSNPLDEIINNFTTRSLNPIKEENNMGAWEQAEKTRAEGEKLKYDEAVFNQEQAEKLYNLIKERDSMNNYEKIEITFKSGETISYGKGEWDDYAFDGKAVIVKKNSAWIGIYNFDDVFCVELK